MRSIEARIIERHFLGAGGETENVVLFENMPGLARSELAARLALDPKAEPVVVARLYPEGRLILCSRYTLFDVPSGLRQLPYSSIDDVKKDLRREALFHRSTKYEWRTLVVKLVTGEELLLETEPGKGFWGLYSAFQFQVHKARRKQESKGNVE